MLTVIRTPGKDAPIRPPETLTDLERIIDTARRSGIEIDTAIDAAERQGLSLELQTAICAALCEALSNTARHAGPTRARVAVAATTDRVQMEVHDDGSSPGWRSERGTGNGLIRIRTRVSLRGGTLTTAPTARGFSLVVEMPRSEDA
ncbi:sensor histidine kinase [Brevibacterium sp. FAM 24638]|uniref:sensor histidine kinase n=1 Tax=unclassified Brevibacterium TaxID=2614124 RepID=UPI003C7D24B5